MPENAHTRTPLQAYYQSAQTDLESLPAYQRFSDEQLEVLYAAAHGRYMSGRYEDALAVFTLLVIYRPLDKRYLRALAATQKVMHQYEEALESYFKLTLLAPEDTFFAAQATQCLLAVASSLSPE